MKTWIVLWAALGFVATANAGDCIDLNGKYVNWTQIGDTVYSYRNVEVTQVGCEMLTLHSIITDRDGNRRAEFIEKYPLDRRFRSIWDVEAGRLSGPLQTRTGQRWTLAGFPYQDSLRIVWVIYGPIKDKPDDQMYSSETDVTLDADGNLVFNGVAYDDQGETWGQTSKFFYRR